MRLDLLLVRLRFAKSRNAAQRMIDPGHMRRNGQRITAHDCPIAAGDVLTLPLGKSVRVIRVETLPARRGPASEARAHYSELDAGGSMPIADRETPAAGQKAEGSPVP